LEKISQTIAVKELQVWILITYVDREQLWWAKCGLFFGIFGSEIKFFRIKKNTKKTLTNDELICNNL